MMFIQPDAELAVNVIHMKTIGIFKIKKSVHQTNVCSVIYGRNCVWIDMQDGSHLCDRVILRLPYSRLFILCDPDICGACREAKRQPKFFLCHAAFDADALNPLTDCHK